MVTSRVIGYRRAVLDAAGFTHFKLEDLDQEQVEEFVSRWYQLACPHNPPEAARLRERLLVAVGDSAAVRELAGNPMLLTILSIIGRRRELPRERRKVYEHAVEVLVEHWDPSKHLRDTRVDQGMPYLDRDDKLELLRLVARRMQDGSAGLAGNHIPGPELIVEFDTYLRDRYALPPDRAKPAAKAMLEQFRERNFILSRFGAGVYGFVHRAFLEYFAAADIVTRFNDRELTEDQLIIDVFGRRWSDPAWEEILLLITGMVPERFAGQIIDHLLAADPLWFLRPDELPRHALLAVRCMGEIRKLGMLSTQSIAVTDMVISLLETAYGSGGAFRANSPLAQAIEQTVLPVFVELGPYWAGCDRYQDWYLLRGQILFTSMFPSKLLMSLAARIGAGLLADSHRFHKILEMQTTISPHATVRQAAVRALADGWRDDPGTLPLLRERATADPDETVREAAVQALAAGWGDDSDTLSLLRDCASMDFGEHGAVRTAAVRALVDGWRDDPGTLPLLRERVTADSDENVQKAAMEALATWWRADPGTLSLLRDCVNSEHGTVRATAVRVLATGWPGALPLLRDRAIADELWSVRAVALRALAALWADDPGTFPLLQERASIDPSEEVRKTAVKEVAAGWRDDPGTLPLLRDRATADPGEYGLVRTVAVEALVNGWRENPMTLALLCEFITADQHEDVRRTAVRALAVGWIDAPETRNLLRECATTDSAEYVRYDAVRALAGWPDDRETLPLLRERITTDPHEAVREIAVRALAAGWRDDLGTQPLICECVTTDQHWSVRRGAAKALAAGWHEDPATLFLLRERASIDPDERVRQVLIQVLAAGWGTDARHHPVGSAVGDGILDSD